MKKFLDLAAKYFFKQKPTMSSTVTVLHQLCGLYIPVVAVKEVLTAPKKGMKVDAELKKNPYHECGDIFQHKMAEAYFLSTKDRPKPKPSKNIQLSEFFKLPKVTITIKETEQGFSANVTLGQGPNSQ